MLECAFSRPHQAGPLLRSPVETMNDAVFVMCRLPKVIEKKIVL